MTGTERLQKIREAVADYVYAEGCSCCRDIDSHAEARERLGKLLLVRKYKDGSGRDFSKYRSSAVTKGRG